MDQIIKELKAVTSIGFDFVGDRHYRELVEVEVSPTVIVRDGQIFISAEDGEGFADYWQDMFINPKLEAIAKKHGAYWEWQDAGSIVLAF